MNKDEGEKGWGGHGMVQIVWRCARDTDLVTDAPRQSVLQSWPKCVGQSAFFPNCCNIRSLPPSPPMQCWSTRRQAFPYEQHCMGGGGEGSIWPKERLFPCEKLIDGRGSAFCKLVPHNFGQDCRFCSGEQTSQWPTWNDRKMSI